MDIRLNNINNVKKNFNLVNFKDIISLTSTHITLWFLILWLFFINGRLREFQFSLYLLSILCFVGGIFIYEINPGYYNYLDKYRIKGNIGRLINVIVHITPFFLISFTFDKNIKSDSGILFLIVFIIYLVFNNPFQVYDIDLDKRILN